MKFILSLVKRIISSCFMIYAIDLILVHLNMMIPINVFTVLFVSLLGSCGLSGLILFKYLIL